ncbi:hypothetical protein MHU86_10788 [Fragilaria crotonensis]|nr:hypothetical protein MHU86_10788 [Fragilaria crotonensis]
MIALPSSSCSSLSPALMSKIQEKTEDSDSFHIVWLQLIKTIQSTSIERFEDLKAAIKARHPSQYAGENLELLASDFRKDARELTTAGQYDHNLTLTMLKTFLLAGGSGNEDFRFQLRATKQKLDQALLDIGYKEKSAAQAHMVSKKLTYQDVCRQAEDAYRLQYDRKEWPPASHATDTRVPSATFGNVALPEGSAITRAEVLNLIQSQTPRQDTPKKGNCHNCGKPGHWSNKCPERNKNGRKNVPGSGTPTNATGAHKTQSWRTVPPPPGTATSKKVKDKAFNWCEKCRRWTTTHTTATHTGQRRNNASAPAPSAQANLSAFSVADPSVWMFDFNDPVRKDQPTSMESIYAFLFSKATILLVYSVIFCLVAPKFANLALQALRSTPWTSFLMWVADSLRHVLREQPTLLFAPALWFALLAAFWKPDEARQQETNANANVSFTRKQRRRFAKLLKTSLKPQREVQRRKAVAPLPYRLRKRRHQRTPNAPTLGIQERLRDLDELKTRTLLLQRQTQRLRTRHSPYSRNVSNKGGIETLDRRSHTQRKKPTRRPKYHPVPADGAPDAFVPAPWTTQQRNAAHKIISHVNLACTATLRMALQAPARMRNALGSATNSAPIIWDSGASISISPDPEDFQGTMRSPGTITQLKGIARGLQIKGQGEVTWAVHDTNGNLRMIKVPAFYVPGIKVRLLSTTSLLQTYQGETIQVESNRLTLSGVPGDPSRGAVMVLVNPQNNLPTSDAFNGQDPFKAADALVATITEVHETNHNLSEAEKELLRWHYRLGHIGFKKIQFLLRTGVLSQTEASRRLPSAACKLTNLPKCAACQYGKQHRRPIPGSTPSTIIRDRTNILKADNVIPGHRISVDHFICSTRGRLLTSAGKTKADEMYTGGCIFVDHASGFVHVELQVNLNTHETLKAKEKFELTCRQYGVVPQEYLADNSKIFTSAEFTKNLSTFAQIMRFAGVGAHHHNGIAERNIRTIMAIARTMMLHAAIHWPSIADATLWPLAVNHAVFLVNHVPDPRTGLCPADLFTKTRWEQRKLNNLHVWGCPVYVLDKMISDGKKLPRWTPRSTRTINMGFSPKHAITVPIVLNPKLLPVNETTTQPPVPSTPLLTPRESPPPSTPTVAPPPHLIQDLQPPSPTQLFQSPLRPASHDIPSPASIETHDEIEAVTRQAPNEQQRHSPRRSTRTRKAPDRLGYDGQQGRGYLFTMDDIIFDWLLTEAIEDSSAMSQANKASVSDPDTLTFEEAMSDVENIQNWLRAAEAEIKSLEKNGTWKEVPTADAKSRILPGTWVFRRKRTPDGAISKYKARYCVRGDLQETEQETFAPVVAWSTAPLTDPVWIHLPRGFRSERGSSTCLQLLKSLYGLSVAPRLWYEHLSDALRDEGFKSCANDPCLLYKDTIMVVIYVDDLGIAFSNQRDLDELFANLDAKGFSFTKEGTFTDFLGINFVKDPKNGTLTLTQKGLIQKIQEATGMKMSNSNWTPAGQAALGIDPDGPPMQESWSYRSVVGMLLYLSTNTRPDIAFAVSQVARFSHNPKKSHASAIKTIVRYLQRTYDKGMIVKPTGDLTLDCYVDADFAGLHRRDPDSSPSSAKSRTGYIITLGGCPILWKSHLQSEISLSTLEAEYSALSSAMRTLLPLRAMLIELINGLQLPDTLTSTVKCRVFEDNNGALLLATNQRITNRTKYFQVKWHFFWAHVRDGTIAIIKVDTQEQWADMLTKGLNRESFERVRRLVQGW